jgi:transcriptional regulator with XRE-family HTH domain
MEWTDDAIDRLYEVVGRNIRQARMEAGVTQTDLGKQLRLTRSSIANIEGGRQRVMLHSVIQIGSALNVPVEKLLANTVEDRVGAELSGQPSSTKEFVHSILDQVEPD